jgi:hypothetical protein
MSVQNHTTYILPLCHSKGNPDLNFNKSTPIPVNTTPAKFTPVEFQSFLCPISMEKFDDPVVDSCGHTFNKHHIVAHFKVRSKDGATFPCPLNPSKMLNINELTKNYSLVDAMEETEKVIAQNEKSLEDRITNLENLFAKSMEATAKSNDKMSKQLEDLHDMYEKAEQLKSANKIRKRQAQNLLNMSLRDRINCVFFCSYLTEVQNRGIDRYELDYLTDRVILNKPS